MDYSIKEDVVELFFDKVKSLIIPSEENNYKSKFLQSNFLLYCVVLLLTLKVITTLSSINFPQNSFFADITKFVLENSVNQTRQSSGLQPLVENQKLDEAAQLKAENMVKNNYFEHTSPSGVTPWYWFLQAGYNYKYAGENLAIGFYDSQEVYNAWLNSPTHKANIVNPNYTEVGTAVLGGFGGTNTIVVVQEFGSRLPVKITTVKNNSSKPVITTNTQVVNINSNNTQVVKTQATNTQVAATNNNGKVLSQSIESNNSLVAPSGPSSLNNLSSKVLNSVLVNYDPWLRDITYGTSLVIIGILLTLIFFNFNFSKKLVFRAVLIVALLSVTALFNKELITSFMPHQIII